MTEKYHHSALPIGTMLRDYRVESILGHGGFGITYKARHDKLKNQVVAIKEYLPNDLSVRDIGGTIHPKSSGSDEENYAWGLERFLQEAQTLASFDHRSIVRILTFFEDNNTAYLVMQYEEGANLKTLYSDKLGQIAEKTLLNTLVYPLLDGLKVIHAQNILHRDIKPENIYVRKNNTPVLLDFGSARQSVSGKSKSLSAIVSSGFAPFEQYSTKGKQGPWTDIYSFGAVLYWLIGGKPADASDRMMAHANEEEDPLNPAVKIGADNYSVGFLTSIDHALRMTGKNRPQSIEAWLPEFTQVVQEEDGSEAKTRALARSRRRPKAQIETRQEPEADDASEAKTRALARKSRRKEQVKTDLSVTYGLTITTKPVDAEVRLLNCDEEYYPGIKLSTGTYKVKIFRDGYDTQRKTVELFGQDITDYIELIPSKPLEKARSPAGDQWHLALDPTCGSGTTAYVAEQWGRRWITIDTSRVAVALARTRMMSAKYPYYLLKDSKEGVKKIAEITGELSSNYSQNNFDIKKGFVYQSIPHITLKSIANNPEIDEIHDKWQVKLEPLRNEINKMLATKWEEWEIPHELPEQFSKKDKKAGALLIKWWQFRKQRQEEIDSSISRNGDQEILYDQPYEDKKRTRVSGPFTIESLSPHRMLSTEGTEYPASEVKSKNDDTIDGVQDFVSMILDNLKKSGAQNTIKDERLKFERLDLFPGKWIQGSGEYTDKNGKSKRVAVSIGPENGTVGSEQIKEAAKEAISGVSFNILLVCGFAFDPFVYEKAKEFGDLTVLPTKMNPDLSIGKELLKKTGSGNLFMVFGEPDIQPVDHNGKLTPQSDGSYIIEIMGIDIYDPTTGEIRSNSTEDIACWFVDTNYNRESFFVRHAYFTGSGSQTTYVNRPF